MRFFRVCWSRCHLKLPLPDDVLVDDLMADLDPGIEQLARQHAKDQGVSASSDDVARLANRALRSPAVVAGMRGTAPVAGNLCSRFDRYPARASCH